MTDIADFDAFALELAAAAAAVTLPLFRTDDLGEQDKGGAAGFDPVTRADRDAEAAIRRLIAARHPDHGVIGEEYGEDRPDAEWTWMLDPIDGTRAFIAGLPLWTTLIALRHEGRPVLGLIAQPYLGEVFIGSRAAARLVRPGAADRPLSTRRGLGLDQAIISCTDEAQFPGLELDAWRRVRAATRLARYGCDAYAYAMLALGRIDLVIESGLKPWDWSALVPVVEGAGGRVTDWSGGDDLASGRLVAAGDPTLIPQTMRLLAG
ncbi:MULTISPECIES: histidinol-phosphatase [Brevundimonas]|uniref:histidinol-phosphatase n=1 Tax=Brevundimonas TaxID=41275 RepID=UPI000F014E4D|nr:histidinol-phosphatase [Brevundimonas lutea]